MPVEEMGFVNGRARLCTQRFPLGPSSRVRESLARCEAGGSGTKRDGSALTKYKTFVPSLKHYVPHGSQSKYRM